MNSEAASTSRPRRVGEVAKATGLTVRALHYYEQVGLLEASRRSDAGHRLYSEEDIARLYRIVLLRRLGLPLAEIHSALNDTSWDLRHSAEAHLKGIEQRLESETRLRRRLLNLVAFLDKDGSAPTDQLLAILEEMTMLDTTIHQRIATLVCVDIERAYEHLERVFGLGPGELVKDQEGRVVHAEIEAGDGVVWLHPESTDFSLAAPSTLGASTSTVAVLVDDVDKHFEHAKANGADVVYGPVDQAYGYREYSARDSEGHLWSFMKPIAAD